MQISVSTNHVHTKCTEIVNGNILVKFKFKFRLRVSVTFQEVTDPSDLPTLNSDTGIRWLAAR